MEGVKKCGNNGCGKEFTEETIDQCCYHPGAPVFHEGLKGWSCCQKRVVDFDDFLALPGCASGKHIVKEKTAPSQPTTAATSKTAEPINRDSTTGKETYSSNGKIDFRAPHPSDKFMPKPVTSPPPGVEKKPLVFVKEYVEEHDPEDAVIQEGAPCCRSGCKSTYVNEDSRKEPCVYHPGEPVFHEGSKGWACCKPKAAIFEEFLKIKGCKTGVHKFVPEKKDENFVECRHDWYQSFNAVYLAVYGKGIDKTKSTVEFLDNKTVSVHFQFTNGKYFKKVYNLAHTFSTNSTFSFLTTKCEIKLLKEPQESWSKLEESELDLYRYQV
eukprot:gene1292-1633_t